MPPARLVSWFQSRSHRACKVVGRPTIQLTERSEGKSITRPQPRISSTLAQRVPGTIAHAFPSALHPALELGGADMDQRPRQDGEDLANACASLKHRTSLQTSTLPNTRRIPHGIDNVSVGVAHNQVTTSSAIPSRMARSNVPPSNIFSVEAL
jgi:hypothetical protein